MKRTLLVIFLTISGLTVLLAQKTNLIFFTENGERFTLILNGVKQNVQPQTNVKITDLIAPSYKVKVIFEDTKLGEVDKNLIFGQGTETTFVIKKNNKNEYVIRYMNEVPLAQAATAVSGQDVVVYTTTSPDESNTSVTHTKTTTTINGGNTPGNEGNVSMGININDPDLGVNINMNVNAPGTVSTSSNSSSTTTYTTTTTTTSSSTEDNDHTQHQHQNQSNAHTAYVMPGYNGTVGCPWPVSPQDFGEIKQSISSKSFDDSKLTIAKQVISTNCLLSSQVKEIMLLFSFEDTRLELAKYAYGYTFDIGNYYKLNDAFTFETSIDELNQYINSYKR